MKEPKRQTVSRRQSLGLIAGGAGLLAVRPMATPLAQEASSLVIAVDPAPRFELSPHLYMQFMEPLGATDGSVEAAWDHLRDAWRADVVEVTRELAPTMLRWGGIFSDFYRWREGVGPRDKRPPMLNLLWGGVESNQVGTGEFVDFARQVGAEPLICVNFESDGRARYMKAKASVRTADAKEAAEWVSYCNDPAHAERRAHGQAAPHAVKYWQIGNETSYDRQGFDLETAARKTVEFAAGMRKADSEIELIAWGDSGWAARMTEVASEHTQMLRPYRRPLIVISPKSLLRHKEAISTLEDLADGRFQNVIGEVEKLDAQNVKRVIACSGKVYYELLAHRRDKQVKDVAIIRLEQQYPFPHDEYTAALKPFPAARDVVWCQEEPQNQGAWYRLREYFRTDALPGQTVAYAGRPVSASTAVGYMSKHMAQQQQLIEDAFSPAPSDGERVYT